MVAGHAQHPDFDAHQVALETDRQEIVRHKRKLITREGDASSRFPELCRDLRQLTANNMDPSRVFSLIDAYERACHGESECCVDVVFVVPGFEASVADSSLAVPMAEEQTWQDTIWTGIHRITARYPEFADVLEPLTSSVLDTKYGVRVAVAAHRNMASSPSMLPLLQFPRVNAPVEGLIVFSLALNLSFSLTLMCVHRALSEPVVAS